MLHVVTKELSLHRLENEHLNNCGKFRAVRDISVAPLDASDQQQIIKLMDETDPSSLFRKKKLFKSPTGLGTCSGEWEARMGRMARDGS